MFAQLLYESQENVDWEKMPQIELEKPKKKLGSKWNIKKIRNVQTCNKKFVPI